MIAVTLFFSLFDKKSYFFSYFLKKYYISLLRNPAYIKTSNGILITMNTESNEQYFKGGEKYGLV